MAAATRIAAVVAGLGGTALIAAAQTKPSDAVSNLAAWARYVGIDTPPAWLSLPQTQLIVTIIGVVVILISAYCLSRRKPDTIPIAISPIMRSGWCINSGLPGDVYFHTCVLLLEDVHITNVATDLPVTLEWRLLVKADKTYPFAGHGRALFGQRLGLDDKHKVNGDERSWLLCPLTLRPAQTASGDMAFLLTMQSSEECHDFLTDKVLDGAQTLEVTDRVSGRRVEIPLPGGYKGK